MQNNKINQLVELILQYGEKYCFWEYRDCLDENPNYPTLLAEEISKGNTKDILDTLKFFTDMSEDFDADYQRIQQIAEEIEQAAALMYQ